MVNQFVLLTLGQGSLQEGFPFVKAQLLANSELLMSCHGSLPAAPSLVETYRQWRLLYHALHQQLEWSSRIKMSQGDILQVSDQTFEELCQNLSWQLNAWLDELSFAPIDRSLRRKLSSIHGIRIIVETEDTIVQRLPWHLWNFLQDYPRAEVLMSLPHWEQKSVIHTTSAQVRVLAILGDCTDIDVSQDQQMLEALPNSEVVILKEPSRQELDRALWDSQGWDILCFAGHSQTEDKIGRLYLNAQEDLTLNELRHSLQAAIENGLQIAIFNSCDGVGLALQLTDLHIPQVIVMREQVLDQVAHEFLRNFLQAFAQTESIHLAVRQAREQLQGLESKFLCASWLPVLFQNPATIPPCWQDLQTLPIFALPKPELASLAIVSTLVTSFVLGMRLLGGLQGLELWAFDHLTQLKPTEPPDDRILVVTIDEADLQWQRDQGFESTGSLSDAALALLLQKIQPYRPRVIALDIYHDFPFSTEVSQLLQQDLNFIAPCEIAETPDRPIGIAAPPDFSPERLGFTDWPRDPDDIMRRHLLGMTSSQDCPTDQSLSLRVALHYLARLAVAPLDQVSNDAIIGDMLFKKFPYNAGGYHLPTSEADGYQILINYRVTRPYQVPLRELLSNRSESEIAALVNQRIILIGVGRTSQDVHLTPFSGNIWPEKTPGVVIHSQMISQILSAVLDQRPLIWWWPEWLEIVWIGLWSLVGGGLVWVLRSPIYLMLSMGIGILMLYGFCYGILIQGGWIPLVPSVLVLCFTVAGACFYILGIQKSSRFGKLS